MKNLRMKLLVVAIAVALIAVISFGTLAFYSTTGTATNVITAGQIDLAIHEKTADGQDFPAEGVSVIPGDVVDKIVTVENVCDHPFYLRVKLVNNSTDLSLSDDCLQVNLNAENWTEGADGYIYYNSVLEPGQITEPVFTQVEVVGEYVTVSNIGAIMSLTVNADALQSENNPAEYPWDAAGWAAE